MHEKLNNGLKYCMIGNLLFLLFGLICLVYYKTFNEHSVISKTFEIIAYACEFGGFTILLWGDWLISSSARDRGLMKLSLTAYIFIEAAMMVLFPAACNSSFLHIRFCVSVVFADGK